VTFLTSRIFQSSPLIIFLAAVTVASPTPARASAFKTIGADLRIAFTTFPLCPIVPATGSKLTASKPRFVTSDPTSPQSNPSLETSAPKDVSDPAAPITPDAIGAPVAPATIAPISVPSATNSAQS
jgi:hypothetical protein